MTVSPRAQSASADGGVSQTTVAQLKENLADGVPIQPGEPRKVFLVPALFLGQSGNLQAQVTGFRKLRIAHPTILTRAERE